MREIKFRAFDEATGEFIFWEVNDKSNWFWERVRNHGLEVEQYTGLKDKNGKDIYEGDILKHSYSNLILWVVGFNHGSFMVQNNGIGGVYRVDSCLFFADREITGNIHEETNS